MPDLEAIRAEHRTLAHELRSYEVVGGHEVFGAEPGSVVELALSEGEEKALVESGHLALKDVEPPALVAAEDDEESDYVDPIQDDLTK